MRGDHGIRRSEWAYPIAVGLLCLTLSGCGGRASISEQLARDAAIALGEEVDDPPAECGRPSDCPSGESCIDEVCRADESCDDGAKRCNDGAVEECQLGAWNGASVCVNESVCVEDGQSAGCVATSSCTGMPQCVSDDVLSFCDPTTMTVSLRSCAQEGASCRDGACVTPECPEGDCSPLVCEPNETLCEDDLLLTCAEDGSGWARAVSCDTGVCRDGQCRPILCPSGELGCTEGDVTLCSLDGTEQLVVDPCEPDEFCEPGAMACQPRVCEPFSITCLGNSIAQCDGLGADYSAVTSCGDEVCEGGVCIVPSLFSERFESPLVGWVDLDNGYTWELTSAVAVEGDQSLSMGGGRNGHYDGLARFFPDELRPAVVTWSARQDVMESGTYLTLHDFPAEPSLDAEVAFVYFRVDGFIAVGNREQGSVPVQPYTLGQWYNIELRIDWDARQFDVLIDDVEVLTDNTFRGEQTVDGIQWISLYHYGPSQGYWDEIRLVQ